MDRDTLKALFQSAKCGFRDKIAVIEHVESARSELTYEELWDASFSISRTASQFCPESAGCCQFIGVCMEQCLLFPAVILGIFHHGFGFACIDPLWTDDKQVEYLRKLGVQLLIHNSERRVISQQPHSVLTMHGMVLYFETLKFKEGFKDCSHPMAYAVLTSGSTGKPKIVRVTHQSIVPNIIALRKICKINSSDVIFLSSPSTFDPSVVDMFLAFTTGASLLITSRSVKTSATKLLQVLFQSKNAQVSVLQTTPSVFNRWSDSELKDIVLGPNTSLRVLLLGGEPFPSCVKLQHCIGSGNKTEIYNIYGITEVSAWASIHPLSFSSNEGAWNVDELNQVPLGKALPDTILQVRDCATNSVISAGCGEMYIGSLRRICEIDDENCTYYHSPVFRATGDIVQIKPDGNIYYIGRTDLTVKRWGHRVNLENIELLALQHASVKRAFCFLDDVSHKLYLIVTLKSDLPISDLRKHFMESQCEKILIPDEILHVQDISLTQHGKVNRRVNLEQLDMQIIAHHNFYVERKFSKITCDLLDLRTLEEGSFLNHGGDSISAMLLTSALEMAFGSCPDNLTDLLLSGKSFQFVCERLCQYYQERQPAVNSPVHDAGEGVLQLEQTFEQSVEKQELLQEQNSNVSIHDHFYNDELPMCYMPQDTLEHIQMTLVWKINMDKCIDASPLCIVYDSVSICLAIGSHSGKFIFVDGKTGEVRWSLHLPSRIESTACCSTCGQYVYIGCYNGVLYCIDTLKGKVKWSFACKAQRMVGVPVLCNEGKNVMFGSYDKHVYCINTETGDLVWSFSEPDPCQRGVTKGSWNASPLVIGQLTILCCLSGNVYALLTSNKSVLWKISLNQPIFSTPVHFSTSSGTYIVIALVKGSLHCVNTLTGKQVWSWKAPGYIYGPLTILTATSQTADTRYKILVSCYDSFLYCFDVNDMDQFTLKWATNLGMSIGSAAFPFVIKTSNGAVNSCAMVSNKVGILFLVSLDDGVICSKYDVEAEVFSIPIVYDSRVYFGCRNDYFYSLCIESSNSIKHPGDYF